MRAPGWYPDEAGEARFWDGAAWSPPALDAIGLSDAVLLPTSSDAAAAAVSGPPTRAELTAFAGFLGLAVGVISVFLPFLIGLVGGLIGLALSVGGTAERGASRPWAIAGIVVSALAVVLIV